MDKRKKHYRVLILSGLILSFLITSLFCISLLYLIGRPASYVWVMDRGDYKNETYLVKMCPTGERLLQIQFGQSGEIAIDPRENIVWASEAGDLDQIYYDQLVQIDQDGKILNRFQGYSSPILAVDPNDGSVWVNTGSSLERESLMTKVASNGKLLTGVGGFYLPSAIALDPRDGSIWVADGGNRNLTHLSKDGEKLFEMRTSGYFFSNAPDQIAVESQNGNVWVADFDLGGSGAIVKFDSDGHIILAQALPSHAHTAGVNPFDGTLWVGVDGEMIRYYDDGRIAGREAGFNEPESIAFAKRGNDLLTEIKCTFYFYFSTVHEEVALKGESEKLAGSQGDTSKHT